MNVSFWAINSKKISKKGEKGLKNASFWAINPKPRPARRKLISRGKKFYLKRGEEGKLSECTIYIPVFYQKSNSEPETNTTHARCHSSNLGARAHSPRSRFCTYRDV